MFSPRPVDREAVGRPADLRRVGVGLRVELPQQTRRRAVAAVGRERRFRVRVLDQRLFPHRAPAGVERVSVQIGRRRLVAHGRRRAAVARQEHGAVK